MARTIVINIDIDLEKSIRSFEELLERQGELKLLQIELQKEAKALRKALRETSVDDLTEDQIEDYERLGKELASVENQLKEVRQAQNLVSREFQAAQTGEESYRRLSIEAAKLERQLKSLSPGDAGFEELAAQVQAANEAVINFDQSINNGRSNVGRYSQNILQAFERAGISVDELDKKNLKALSERQDQLTRKIAELGREYQKAGNLGQRALQSLEKEIEDTDKELREINAELTETEQRLKAVSGVDLGRITEGFAANFSAQALLDFTKNAVNSLREFGSEAVFIQDSVRKLFAGTGEDLDLLAAKIQATSRTFDQDYKEVLQAVNTLSKEFGISGVEATDKINKLLLEGSNLSDDFLQQIREYSTFFAQAGEEADDFLSVLVASENAGIFDDKATDSIKEFFLSVREGTKATREAFAGLGIDYQEEIDKINSGNGSFNDLLLKTSEKIGELPAASNEAGTAIADIFRGAGEDAGTFIQNLQAITGELAKTPDALTPLAQAQEALLQLNEEISKGAGALANELLPVGTEILKIFKDLVVFIRENSEAFKTLGISVAAAVAAQKAYNVVSALFARSTTGGIKALDLFNKGFKNLNKTLRANLFGIIVAAIGVLITVFQQVKANIDTVSETFNNFFDRLIGFTERIPIVGKVFSETFQAIRAAVNIALDAIENFPATLAGLRGAAGVILDRVVNQFLSFGNTVQLVFQRIRR